MTASVLLLQVALPLALLAWLFFLPAGSLVGFSLQMLGVGAFLVALARIAQWALPVWWLPWVYAGLWIWALLAWILRPSSQNVPVMPMQLWDWAALALSVLLLGVGGWYGAQALSGKRPPPVDVVDVANPFGPGHYLVGHGGSRYLVNGHLKTLDDTVPRFRAYRGQSYAVDFFGIGPFGLRATGWRPADPAAYAIFGAPLVAPCGGTVVASENDAPDFDVPGQDTERRLGNHVILRCGEAEIVLAHMRRGSLTVAPGDTVAEGDPLGQVGNSGATSEPHLHIHAQRPAGPDAPPLSGAPLGLRIDGRFLVRGDRLRGRAE